MFALLSEIPLLLKHHFMNQVDMLVNIYFLQNSIYCIAFSCSNTLTYGEKCKS